jgi:hypothetical protein
MRLLLDDPEMDAQLSRTLIAIAAEAADIGEALATASRTTAGDYDSWFTEWSTTAQAARALADDALNRGHLVTARKAYLRASEYWRQSFFLIRHDIDDERLQNAWRQHRSAFRAALPLFDCYAVATEIPFDGVAMTGYLFRPADDGTPRPTVLAPCGFDSTAEAGYCATGYMALARGYNFFVFEGPGQGGMLFEHRRAFRPDFEVPFGAAFEPRVAALVADPGQYDFASRVGVMAKGLSAANPDDFLAKLMSADPDLDAELQALLAGSRSVEWYGSRMAAMGATGVGDFIRTQLTFTLDGVVGDIRCPTLLTEGEGDFASQSQLLYDHLRCEKVLKQFTEAEGAGGHCEGFGATLFEGYVFDWLDEVLAKRLAAGHTCPAPTAAM